MNELSEILNEIISFPQLLMDNCTFLPEYVKMAFTKTIYFVPILIILYYLIELLEKFFLKNIFLFIKFLRNFGGIFGAALGVIPECNYAVLTSIFYSRNIISRGTLLGCLIMCSDDALPLLFLEPSKALIIIPILVIKFMLALGIAFGIDIFETVLNLRIKRKDDLNSVNTDIEEFGCCHHSLNTKEKYPNIMKHTIAHSVNIFMFLFITLTVLYYFIEGYGSAENFASALLINSPIPIFVVSVLGLIPNCVISVIIVSAYVLGLISFPAFFAGMVSVSGIALLILAKHGKKSSVNIVSLILFVTSVAMGLAFYYNLFGLDTLAQVFIR